MVNDINCPYCKTTFVRINSLNAHITKKHQDTSAPGPSETIQTVEKKIVETKGQLISKCPFSVIVWIPIPTKKFPGFLP